MNTVQPIGRNDTPITFYRDKICEEMYLNYRGLLFKILNHQPAENMQIRMESDGPFYGAPNIHLKVIKSDN